MTAQLSITQTLRRIARPAVARDADDPKFITVNGAAAPIGKGGELKGEVGEKIQAGGEGKSISITGNELGSYADAKELRQKAVSYYKDNLQGKPARRDDIGEIRFSRKGLEETRYFSADTDKLLMVPALRDIIETGTLGKEETLNHPRKDGIVAFIPIKKTIDFQGKPKDVEALVGKDGRGNLYYDLFLDNSRKKESPGGDVVQKLRLTRDSKTGDSPMPLNISFSAPPVKREAIALDSATRRRVDENGFLHVSLSHISKEIVNPYYGREIPGCEELGLDPERIYQGYRSGAELAKGADTFNGLPILMGHHAESADNPQKEHRVGSLGTDAAFNAPYLDNSLIITDADAIKAIESGRAVELSSAYRYDPVFEPGEFGGEAYDFIMTNIRGNHVALVEEGRAGPDVVVADQQIKQTPLRRFGMGIKELIEKLKAFVASAEASGAEIDPDSLAKGKELVGDLGAFVEGQEGGKAQDDALGDLGAEVYALIDTIEDRELAAKIKAKIEEARAAGATDNDPAKKTPEGAAADDEGADAFLAKLTEAFKEISPDEVYSFTRGMEDMANKEKLKEVATKIQAAISGAPSAATPQGTDNDLDPAKKATDDDPAAKEGKPLTAQDAAIIRSRAKQEASAEIMAKIRSLNEAAHSVRGLCGEVDPLAFDSAADIYRHALKAAGRTITTRDAAALRDMVVMAMDAKAAVAASRVPAFDSTEMSGPFAGLNSIKLG
jgi:hypothetical protein